MNRFWYIKWGELQGPVVSSGWVQQKQETMLISQVDSEDKFSVSSSFTISSEECTFWGKLYHIDNFFKTSKKLGQLDNMEWVI